MKVKIDKEEFYYQARIHGFNISDGTTVLYYQEPDFITLEGTLVEPLAETKGCCEKCLSGDCFGVNCSCHKDKTRMCCENCVYIHGQAGATPNCMNFSCPCHHTKAEEKCKKCEKVIDLTDNERGIHSCSPTSEERRPCTHSQHPSGAMYCGPDCSYRGSPTSEEKHVHSVYCAIPGGICPFIEPPTPKLKVPEKIESLDVDISPTEQLRRTLNTVIDYLRSLENRV